MPVIAPLNSLTDEAMLSILTKPKNAIIKQYQKLFELENIHLEFTANALKAIVKKAQQRKTGARALRSIIEELMLDLMYSLPSQEDVKEYTITEQMVDNLFNSEGSNLYKSICLTFIGHFFTRTS